MIFLTRHINQIFLLIFSMTLYIELSGKPKLLFVFRDFLSFNNKLSFCDYPKFDILVQNCVHVQLILNQDLQDFTTNITLKFINRS